MYIDVRAPRPTGDPRAVLHLPARCGCQQGHRRLGATPTERRRLRREDALLLLPPETDRNRGIRRRVASALVSLGNARDATLYNTAQRFVDGTVRLDFIDVQDARDAAAILGARGYSSDNITSTLRVYRIAEMPGVGLIKYRKSDGVRAFERAGVIYVPTSASDVGLESDLVHEVNHAMNPVPEGPDTVSAVLEAKFIAEVRAQWVADPYVPAPPRPAAMTARAPTDLRTIGPSTQSHGQSERANIDLRRERAIQRAFQQADLRLWTSLPSWDGKRLAELARAWRPDGNLDNGKPT